MNEIRKSEFKRGAAQTASPPRGLKSVVQIRNKGAQVRVPSESLELYFHNCPGLTLKIVSFNNHLTKNQKGEESLQHFT